MVLSFLSIPILNYTIKLSKNIIHLSANKDVGKSTKDDKRHVDELLNREIDSVVEED
jgi:hypothetical protein